MHHASLGFVFLTLFAIGAGLGGAVRAEEEPAGNRPPVKRPAQRPLTPAQSAGAVLEAVWANDRNVLKALADKDAPDPWLVADELCFRAEYDAAKAFATASPREAVERLPEYVAVCRARGPDRKARKRLDAVQRARRTRDWASALSVTADLSDVPDSPTGVLTVYGRAVALMRLRRFSESADAFRNAAGIARRVGWSACTASARFQAGRCSFQASDWRAAQVDFEDALATYESLGDQGLIAETLNNLGIVQFSLGSHGMALASYERALDICRARRNELGIARASGNIANLHKGRGDFTKALELYARTVDTFTAIGDQSVLGMTFDNMGSIYRHLGDYAKARHYHARALAIAEALDDEAAVGRVLVNLGILDAVGGDYPAALALYRRALEIKKALRDLAGMARTLNNIGIAQRTLGDYRRALDSYAQAIELKERIGDRAGIASTLANIGVVHDCLGQYDAALEFHTRALDVFDALGLRANAASTLCHIGNLYRYIGDYARALELHAQSLEMCTDLDDPVGIARASGSLGLDHERRGNHTQALEFHVRALDALKEVDAPAVRAQVLWGTARAHFLSDEFEESIQFARAAITEISGLFTGLGEQEGATARDLWTGPFEVGARAAFRAESKDDLVYFLESGRAVGLREALAARRALVTTLIPADLRAAEATARARETSAQKLCQRARERGNLSEIREAREALDKARDTLEAVIQRIQQDARAGADIAYPEAASLASIQGWLRAGEVLLLLGPAGTDVVAVVVTPEDVETRLLGPTKDLEALIEALDLSDPKKTDTTALEALRERVVKPLGLDDETARVLVSPYGALSYVPFALLLPQHEVTYVPSGTTYGLLTAEREKRGFKVLAFGDPDYGAHVNGNAVSVLRRRRGLHPLPGTRKEVRAVGDRVLLGGDATEGGLVSAVKKRERWRAVHLACHGLIDVEWPMFSSLALTPDGDSDGFLTVLEIFRLKIPADLVVLSACETATGKVYRAEGIVGLARAFMHAGAPRVLCSLWQVDDEATCALMEKFYELWNPKEGKGRGAAEALRKAQAYIKGHEKWKHPSYWAAWVLWGLPD